MSTSSKYWFPAKKYGWGWGLPITWQGWAITFGYFVTIVAGAMLLDPSRNMVPYLLLVAVATGGLLSTCWAKGEPPSWRWGGK
jgi:hypothetical protein